MKKSLSTAMMALGALVLIFCIAFTVVQLCSSNFSFFEQEFTKLGLDDSMHMTVGDISKGLQALIHYMNGKVDTIDVDIVLNGEVTPMYALEIEHVHMVEVREVWRGFETARNLGFLAVALLVLGAFMVDNQNTLRNAAVGYLWALGAALVACLFLGVWASTNFNSFWTQFHKIIFPNSENWLLPSSSRMIQMLPGDLFQDLVMYCGGIIVLILVLLGAGAVVALAIPKRKGEKAAQMSTSAPEKTEARKEFPQQEEPDLVLMHRLLNMSVTHRNEVKAELALKQQLEAQKQQEEGEEESTTEASARVKIDFAAYEGEALDPQIDEEEQEEAQWLEALAQERKEKKAGKSKKSSSKKKKKPVEPETAEEAKGTEVPVLTETPAPEEAPAVEQSQEEREEEA